MVVPMRIAPAWALGVATMLTVGCQNYERGIQLICEAPLHCSECNTLPPAERITALGEYADKHLRNEDAKKAMATVRQTEPAKRAEALRALAELAGVPACPLADVMAAVP